MSWVKRTKWRISDYINLIYGGLRVSWCIHKFVQKLKTEERGKDIPKSNEREKQTSETNVAGTLGNLYHLCEPLNNTWKSNIIVVVGLRKTEKAAGGEATSKKLGKVEHQGGSTLKSKSEEVQVKIAHNREKGLRKICGDTQRKKIYTQKGRTMYHPPQRTSVRMTSHRTSSQGRSCRLTYKSEKL